MYEELRGMVETAASRATNDQMDPRRGPLRRLDLRESALLARYKGRPFAAPTLSRKQAESEMADNPASCCPAFWTAMKVHHGQCLHQLHPMTSTEACMPSRWLAAAGTLDPDGAHLCRLSISGDRDKAVTQAESAANTVHAAATAPM